MCFVTWCSVRFDLFCCLYLSLVSVLVCFVVVLVYFVACLFVVLFCLFWFLGVWCAGGCVLLILVSCGVYLWSWFCFYVLVVLLFVDCFWFKFCVCFILVLWFGLFCLQTFVDFDLLACVVGLGCCILL